MASQEAHDWWGDVQDERDALEVGRRRRAVAVWADVDDLDLVPESVVTGRTRREVAADELADRRAARGGDIVLVRDEPSDGWDAGDDAGEDRVAPIRGHRFVRASHGDAAAAPRRIVLEQAGEIDHVLPPRGEGGIVEIKGRPEERRAPLPARYERPTRSAREIVEHNPDRIMLWVTALGFLLILLAFSTG